MSTQKHKNKGLGIQLLHFIQALTILRVLSLLRDWVQRTIATSKSLTGIPGGETISTCNVG